MTLVVFALVDGVHLLDLAGPAQVFDTAGYRLAPVAARPQGHERPGACR